MVAPALAVPQAFDRLRLEPLHTLQSYLFWPATNFQGKALPLLAVGWTLQYEMYFYLVLTGLLLLRPRWLVPALTCVFGSSVALGMLYPLDAAPLRLMTSPLLLDVLIGAWLARWHLRGVKTPRPVGVILFVGGTGVLLTLATLGIEPGFSRVLWFGLPSAAVTWGLLSLERSGLRAFQAPWSAWATRRIRCTWATSSSWRPWGRVGSRSVCERHARTLCFWLRCSWAAW